MCNESSGVVKKVLVTGANGFVGRALCPVLEAHGHQVVRVTRSHAPSESVGSAGRNDGKLMVLGDIEGSTDWGAALGGVTDIVHLAAHVHSLRDAAGSAAYHAVNVQGTERLARMAAQSGVRRFVFLSSIKVNGERTSKGMPFKEIDQPRPSDAYAQSKWEAEQRLRSVAAETGLEVAILRPPLVYGAGVKANLLRLMHWIDKGFPLPLGLVNNRRSLLYLGNLVDAIMVCLSSPQAVGKTFLVSDGEDVSTPDLIRLISRELGRSPVLFPLPLFSLRAVGALAGKRQEVARLEESLEVDSSLIRQDLGWKPPYSLQEGIEETVRWFVATHKKKDR